MIHQKKFMMRVGQVGLEVFLERMQFHVESEAISQNHKQSERTISQANYTHTCFI
jgi:hypothetical protein